MALLAQNDWHPPHDSDSMDSPANRSQHPSAPRQSSPDTVQHSHGQGQPQFIPQPSMQQQQQQQPYPTQSQPWQPSPQAAPFFPAYPSFFPTPGPLPHPGTSPYFDPNIAHWAYQQMLFNAQAQAQFHAQQQQQHQAQQQMLQQPEFPRMRSGTPPQQSQHQPSDYFQQPRSDGFHPYPSAPRRPGRQASSSPSTSATPAGSDSPPQPPYARADSTGSSSSVNSGSSGGSRTRKGSNPSPVSQHTHGRTISSTSRTSTNDRPASIKSVPNSLSSAPPARPNKPSPLGLTPSYSAVVANGTSSQSASRPSSSGTIRPPSPTTPRAESSPLPSFKPTHNKRLSISKDDSQLGDPVPVPNASMVRSGGLKGRLRRALSFNASSTLDEVQEGEDGKLNSRRKALANASKNNAVATAAASSSVHTDDTSPPDSPSTPTGPTPPSADTKGKSRLKRSLFNSKLNASTDNISLSSTVSSASVMIRKLGSMGRLARKNSLMTITSLFGKDKDKRGGVAEASVTHATAEVDRGSDSDMMSGLTPAARLARQHTLRSNEEAARRKAEEEVKAKEREAHETAQQQHQAVPVWERGTTNKRGDRLGGVIKEDEEDGSGSDSDDSGTTYDPHRWEDDDQDVTIRIGHPQVYQGSPPISSQRGDEDEPWAMGIRRSVERTRRPTKGILKNASSYDQETVLPQNSLPPNTRLRSNSYNHNSVHAEPGPLARIPSPDPDHIDGLHQHKDYLPPFTFEAATQHRSSSPQPEKSFFNLANMNSSAPALSSIGSQSNNPPPLTHRSATTPAKRLTFAANLSIYDTFSSAVYDRRSEPATCNRLTPVLAQRIKEELNSYKMEEMEVHAASRIHTQFFV